MRVSSGKEPSSPAMQGATAAAGDTGVSAATATRQSEADTEADAEERDVDDRDEDGRDDNRAEDNRMNT
ncbi:hypothetical protein HEK131_08500 [Streptomyces seoulensis]|nr:hypothetical protein HEK131_08500 [Streptomyces seoulensis]